MIIAISDLRSINIANVTFFSTATSNVHFSSGRAITLHEKELKNFASIIYSNMQKLPNIIVLPTLMVNMSLVEIIFTGWRGKTDQLILDFVDKSSLTIDGDNYEPFVKLLIKRAPQKQSRIVTLNNNKIKGGGE